FPPVTNIFFLSILSPIFITIKNIFNMKIIFRIG
ncbi:unnamed protein product, partial [marine sediment metagenome]